MSNTRTQIHALIALALASVATPGTALTLVNNTAADNQFFGDVFAQDGDTLLSGSPSSEVGSMTWAGEVRVWVRSGDTWTLQATLVAPSPAANDIFGQAVAISGDTALIGAPSRFNNGVGKAFVFVRSGTTWTLQQQLTPSDTAVTGFGRAVSVDGNTAAVGVYKDIFPNNEQPIFSSAFVFVRSGSSWAEQQKLVTASDDGNSSSVFSRNGLQVRGNALVLGVPYEGTTGKGAAYCFTRSGSIWTSQQKLTATSAPGFGVEVALSDGVLVVGATPNFSNSPGAAFVYVPSGSGWTQAQKLTSGDAETDDFGQAVSIFGDYVLVGAGQADTNLSTSAGAAFLYKRDGSLWYARQKLTAPAGVSHSLRFGSAFAFHQGRAVIYGVEEGIVRSRVFDPMATVLQNSVTLTGTSGPPGSELLYTLDVPAGATSLTFSLSSGGGDADLFVLREGVPSPFEGEYTCSSTSVTSDEMCNVSPVPGRWYALVYGYTDYSGVSVLASYTVPDTIPDPFSFSDVTDVPRSTAVTSNTVTIQGINSATPISVSNGEYSIGCGATFTTSGGTVSNGQTVCVRHVSSSAYDSATGTVLTIGGISDTFTSTTEPEPGANGGGAGGGGGFAPGILWLALVPALRRRRHQRATQGEP